MLQCTERVNLSSENPSVLAAFYRRFGVPVYTVSDYADSWQLDGKTDCVCIWDALRWGKPTANRITVVFRADDLQQAYEALAAKEIQPDPPHAADWVGKELTYTDPDGNRIIIR